MFLISDKIIWSYPVDDQLLFLEHLTLSKRFALMGYLYSISWLLSVKLEIPRNMRQKKRSFYTVSNFIKSILLKNMRLKSLIIWQELFVKDDKNLGTREQFYSINDRSLTKFLNSRYFHDMTSVIVLLPFSDICRQCTCRLPFTYIHEYCYSI